MSFSFLFFFVTIFSLEKLFKLFSIHLGREGLLYASSYLFDPDTSNPAASKCKIKFPASSLLHFGARVCIIHHDISSVYRHGIRDTATIISSPLLVVSRRIVKAESQKNLRISSKVNSARNFF